MVKKRKKTRESFLNYCVFKFCSFLYDLLYETRIVHSDEDKAQAYRIRYDVYCAEYGFEDAKRFLDKQEKDDFDDHAEHALLIHKSSGRAVGTVRVLPPNALDPDVSFPILDAVYKGQMSDALNIARMSEISRLCVLKDFRGGKSLSSQHNEAAQKVTYLAFYRKFLDKLAQKLLKFGPLGLLRASFEMSINRKLDRACAIMEPRLIRSLERVGISCERIGPVMDYHGQRQPVIIDFLTTTSQMRLLKKSMWEMFTYKGRLHQRAELVYQHNEMLVTTRS